MPISFTETKTTSIDAPLRTVAMYLADPMNHPAWGTEFFKGSACDNGDGTVSVCVPMMGGPALMKISSDVDRGIIDVYLAPDGVAFGDPLPVRLVPNGDGVDVLWTLKRPEGIPDDAWQDGLRSMTIELANLKALMESS